MKKAIGQILSGNVLSKGLGLFREILMSKYFGTGEVNGAYRIAQSGTLVPINFMISDSLNSAFIPLYKKYLLENSDKAETFKWCIFFIFLLMSLLLFSILYFFSGFWVSVLAPGINESTKTIAITLLKIMAISCPFYLCSALMNYVSMAHNDFKPMSMRNPVQNVGMLIGVFLSYYSNKIEFLAWGFTASYIYFCIWSLARKGARKIILFPSVFVSVEIKKVMVDFWLILRPLLILPVILQGNITLERALSSLVGLDAVSSLDYAKFITETVIFFLSVPVAFAGLSAWVGLSIEHVKIKLEELYTILVVLGLTVSFFLYFYSKEIITILFHRGAFNEDSVNITSEYLRGMCFGLWAQVIGYIFLKALSAQLQNKKVLLSMAISLFGNAIFNLLFYRTLGAFGIGLGCSAYGVLLLISSAYFLGIHKILIQPIVKISIGIFIYYLIMSRYPYFQHFTNILLFDLLIKSLGFFLFFTCWCFCFKEIRVKFKNLLLTKKDRG